MGIPIPQYNEDPDIQLVEQMIQGDTQALNDLYARHGGAILGFLTSRLSNRQLAEEVLQDVMMAVWKNAGSFRGDSKVKTWLYVIARNRAINAQRKRSPEFVHLNEAYGYQSDDTGPMERMIKLSNREGVRSAIDQLPEGQKEVLILVFYNQLSGPETAAVLGISEGTVKSRLHRAKHQLKQLLGHEGGF